MNGNYYGGKPKKRIDADRFVIFIMVVLFLIAAVWYGISAYQKKHQPVIGPIEFTTPTAEPTPEPTPTPAPSPTPFNEAALSYLRPEPEADGYLPVFSRALTSDMKVALIVEECVSSKNIRTLMDTCAFTGAHLTFFPTGEEITDAELWCNVIDAGHEIENHTNANRKLYQLTEEEMIDEISSQAETVSMVLGGTYEMHFLLPYLGEGTNDIRTHRYLAQENYRGMAYWTVKMADLKDVDQVEPGMVILVSASNKTVGKVQTLIKKLADAGYEVVTLNELFGYPANEITGIDGEPILDVEDIPEADTADGAPAGSAEDGAAD